MAQRIWTLVIRRCSTRRSEKELERWPESEGHFQSHGVRRMKPSKNEERLFKHVKKAFRADGRLQPLHTDVCGPLKVKSMVNSVYFMKFLEDYSRRTFVYTLKHKSEVDGCVRNFVNFVNFFERQTGDKVKLLRSYNGG